HVTGVQTCALPIWITGAPAAAEEDDGGLYGSAVIEQVAPGAIVLAGQRFAVGASTRIEGEQGDELLPSELPSLAGGASADDAAAWFEADPGAAGRPPVLRRLRLTGSIPK